VYDPLSAGFRHDREAVYRRLRDEAPVHLDADRRIAVLSRFEDVRGAALDWAWGFESLRVEFPPMTP
jgi:hypothetical protein